MKQHEGHKRSLWVRILKWTGISVGCLILLVVAALCVATWWLTPYRLTRLVNEKASEMLNADVSASDIRFTLWSTFPHLDIEMDSLHVRSRNFDSIPQALRAQLPADADFLLSTSRMHGGINLLKLLAGQIWLRDLQVDSLKVNLLDATDSLNNYDISHTQGAFKVPYFNIDKLRIARGGSVKYTSIPSNSVAEVGLTKAGLMPAGEKNAYRLALAGDVTAISDGLVILNDFPVVLDGDIELRFKPFGVLAKDYKVSLGSINGKMSVDMDLAGDVKLNKFNYCLQDFTLDDLYQMLPEGSYPVLRKISANVALDCSAYLTTPYNFASAYLPSVNVDFSVPDGEIDYSLSDNTRYSIKNVKLNGCLVFNGRHPEQSYIEIPEFMLEGGGAVVDAEARVVDLTTDPVIRARIRGNVDLARAARVISELKPYSPAGEVAFQANVGFRVADNILYGSVLDLNVESPQATLTVDGNKITVRDLRAHSEEQYADGLSRDAVTRDIPADLRAKARSVSVTMPQAGAAITVNGFSADGRLSREGGGAVLRNMDIEVSGKRTDVRMKGTGISLDNTRLNLSASHMAKPQVSPDYATPALWSADARSLGFAKHTPELLQADLSESIRDLMKRWRSRLEVKVASASMHTPGYETPTIMRGLDLTATFDSVTLNRVALKSGRSGGEMSASVTNLRQFLTSRTPAPLKVSMDLRFDTIQINQLARAYAAAHPEVISARHEERDTAQMTGANVEKMAFIVPRNLFADIHLSAAQTRYINLHLYDLLANVSIANGNASVDSLHIAADFGNADMAMKYCTANLQDMCIDADLGINDVNVVKFFQNFHSLLEMMPQMKNLSGMLSADVKGRVRVFPNMNLMVPSLWANAYVEGWDLVLHQNSFIRHVTDMLLIPSNEDLQIADMKVHAGIHSNLLEVFPFIFEVEKYKLCLGGLNNFNGDLYYHIGVEDWPLKFPFGINVKGTYSHPELKFGGKAWHDSNGAKITAGVQDYDRINLVDEARKYAKEFVHTAATYQGE